jgi:hypothetical protein
MAKHAGKGRTVMTGRSTVQWLRELDPRIGPPFELRTLLPVVLAATMAGAVAYVGANRVGTASAGSQRKSNPECAGMARSIANRAHSMLDGTHFRATERQAYGICTADPAAFRRIIRGH